jgi:hypothetical protein
MNVVFAISVDVRLSSKTRRESGHPGSAGRAKSHTCQNDVAWLGTYLTASRRFRGEADACIPSRLPFANVRTAVDVQHLPSDVWSLGQINHGIHNFLNGRNASHWG